MIQLFAVLLLVGNVMIINAAPYYITYGGQTSYDSHWKRECRQGML